jgi:superfamily II DNA or RNA helicase
MSIAVPINELTVSIRHQIIREVKVKVEHPPRPPTFIYPYHITDDESTIYLPYHYARTLGWTPRSREMYQACHMTFEGVLRDNQREIKRVVIDQLNTQGVCLLSLHVGWGKSVLAIYLACKLRLQTLIVVNRVVLAKQWVDLIHRLCPSATVQFLKAKVEPNPDADVYVINALNIPKHPVTLWERVGTVIADEIHLLCAKTLYTSNHALTPRYLIGLSATPYRPDGLNGLIELFYGPCTVTRALSCPHHVYAIHTGYKIQHETTATGQVDWNSVLNAQAEHEERNQWIIRIIQQFPDRCFLVLCKRVTQGRQLAEGLREQGITVTDLFGSDSQFDSDARVVVATSQKCGVGFSHDKLNALLLASDTEEYFIQYLGRVFRTPDTRPVVFDLIDQHPILKRHFNTRKKVYVKAGGTIHTVRGFHSLESLTL